MGQALPGYNVIEPENSESHAGKLSVNIEI